jgi:phenylalanyl-tRNA synthetase beta subunit
LSIILQNTIKFKEIEKIIKEQGSYLTDMKIVDIYEGKDIPPESRAFTVRIFYQSKEKTLTSQG